MDYHGWSHFTVEFDGPMSIVSTAVCSPSFDLLGNELQDWSDYSVPLQGLHIAMTPTQEGNAVVFSWREKHTIPRTIISQMKELQVADLPHVITQFLFRNCENVFFSTAWWEGLDEHSKASVMEYAAMLDLDDWRKSLDQIELSPWKIRKCIEVES